MSTEKDCKGRTDLPQRQALLTGALLSTNFLLGTSGGTKGHVLLTSEQILDRQVRLPHAAKSTSASLSQGVLSAVLSATCSVHFSHARRRAFARRVPVARLA
jgi:hypothetical protein